MSKRKSKPRAPKADAPPASKLSALLAQSVSPLLDARPAGAQSIREMAAEHGVSVDVIRRQLEEYRAAGVKLRHARVKLPKGGYTIMYWVE